jgi:outer membrane protein OmpA-like peptidoglycan-associated protein
VTAGVRRAASLLAASVAVTAAACASHSVKAPEVPGESLVALLPDPETGHVGRATVTNAAGRVELNEARESTVARQGVAPTAVTTLTSGDARRLFGGTLEALPPRSRHFTLYFAFDSEQLTPESGAVMTEIVAVVRAHRVPDVLIVGHTDTTGSAAGNFALGLRRANTVQTLLREAGLESAIFDVVSHGESDPLVPTGDGVFEARNRRVEITVR